MIARKQVLARIAQLAIPPAWQEVWIATDPRGHLQATGRDARGRKQYRYHPRWTELSNRAKFERLLIFGRVLPQLRRRVQRDLRRRGLDRRRMLAAVVEILDRTCLRIGNREYAETNGSYGLTTLTSEHVEVVGANIRFRFTGKGRKPWEARLHDRLLAGIIRRSQAAPGDELFQHQTAEGSWQDVTSQAVNDYLEELTGLRVTAKVFRSWRGTVTAAALLRSAVSSGPLYKKTINAVIRETAQRLGNTPSVCRSFYISPRIFDVFSSPQTAERLSRFRPRIRRSFDDDEQLTLHLLESLAR
jgi:DNA topoisomerase-1